MNYRFYVKILIILVVLALVDYLAGVILKALTFIFPKIAPYSSDVFTAITVIVIAVGGYYIIRAVQSVFYQYLLNRVERNVASTIKVIIDVVLYTILVMVILAALKVNLTGVLVGGAVGGIVIGLAVQTIAQNILSGILVTASRTVKQNDALSLSSWIWGSPIVGEVVKVSLLFTDVKTTNGNLVRIPNSAFLGNTVFQKLESENSLIYPYQLLVNADVPANDLLQLANSNIQDSFAKARYKIPQVFFTGKNGGTNSFTVIVHFERIDQLNEILNLINQAFDKAYWELKKKQ
ncbi:mechanosensitive ion channel protein MscS [Sulfolobus sp. A20]|uniref:mechanosensitive ion channel domain-containing protein n=1 Tax=Sulfolobaceae TaxID=118883 RepID=UPI0008460648|nr:MULTISPECIES: mechanosensitive ion channel family protein [unclassified Sulfolobus]TRM76920.1 mechanosensitive ion channel family protein [Sulfolobus sp. E5]TRM82465.1 mechanosensitive ion channel family protein [Sulfolobus sp. D5]TRN01520.1 mechanosensitive ion channel family protein [Sulfolobus sp. F1]AOL17174.1 mechanosensitive ion channel protein MscS [Sulfolobus sp. A20]TRM97780.1 mechanosensitive ion channel family protein [Sulfolobus sp. B1]